MTTVAAVRAYLLSTLVELAPNAGPQPRLPAAATKERRLEAVACKRLLGPAPASGGLEKRFLTPFLLLRFWQRRHARILLSSFVWENDSASPLLHSGPGVDAEEKMRYTLLSATLWAKRKAVDLFVAHPVPRGCLL